MECNSDQNFIAISGFKMSEKYFLNTDKDKTLIFAKLNILLMTNNDELMSTKDKKFWYLISVKYTTVF